MTTPGPQLGGDPSPADAGESPGRDRADAGPIEVGQVEVARMEVGRIDIGRIEVGRVDVERVIDLRHGVLREGLPRSEAIFAGDHAADAIHVAATLDGRVIGCGTFHPDQWESRPSWRLRGMATAPGYRGLGVGSRVLDRLVGLSQSIRATQVVWCNARVPAVGFYQSHGWEIVSEQFNIPTAGPHHRMIRRITPIEPHRDHAAGDLPISDGTTR